MTLDNKDTEVNFPLNKQIKYKKQFMTANNSPTMQLTDRHRTSKYKPTQELWQKAQSLIC